MALEALIQRLEAATESSHEMDVAIATVCYEGGFGGVNYDPALWVERHGGHSASIDAALTLVPEGLHWSLYDTNGSGIDECAVAQLEPPEYSDNPWNGEGKTPALAICIASLIARMAIARLPLETEVT